MSSSDEWFGNDQVISLMDILSEQLGMFQVYVVYFMCLCWVSYIDTDNQASTVRHGLTRSSYTV